MWDRVARLSRPRAPVQPADRGGLRLLGQGPHPLSWLAAPGRDGRPWGGRPLATSGQRPPHLPSMHNRARSALLVSYAKVPQHDLPWFKDIGHARRHW